MEVAIADIRKSVNKVLDHIEITRGILTVKIAHDLFWDIPFEERYNPNNKPGEMGLNSLADEWDFASNLRIGDDYVLAYQLCQLAPLLDYIGHTLGWKLASEGG